MKKYLILIMAVASMSFFTGCESNDDFTPLNYVTFENSSPADIGVESGESAAHEITVYAANVVGNDRTFNIEVVNSSTLDAAAYEVPSSVTIPGGSNVGTFTVEVSDVNLGLTGKNLILNFQEEEGLYAGEPYILNVTRTCVGTEFVVNFTFDGYASEIGWTLKDVSGATIVTGGGYADGLASTSQSLCLDKGTYTFRVTDSFGDGLTFPNEGSITLSYAGEVLEEIPGNFGEETSVEVTF